MINVVYLVLVFTYDGAVTTTIVPQANMAQCQINAKNYPAKKIVKNSVRDIEVHVDCIVGVK